MSPFALTRTRFCMRSNTASRCDQPPAHGDNPLLPALCPSVNPAICWRFGRVVSRCPSFWYSPLLAGQQVAATSSPKRPSVPTSAVRDVWLGARHALSPSGPRRRVYASGRWDFQRRQGVVGRQSSTQAAHGHGRWLAIPRFRGSRRCRSVHQGRLVWAWHRTTLSTRSPPAPSLTSLSLSCRAGASPSLLPGGMFMLPRPFRSVFWSNASFSRLPASIHRRLPSAGRRRRGRTSSGGDDRMLVCSATRS